jgi:serine/threonine protein kinase
LAIIDQVASALDAAHGLDRPPDKRMVHRDVKPANVLVETRPDGSDHVYLADFGVARALVPGTRITQDGGVVGTPAYMAPELWEADHTDHRVDVYSLAVMTFELLTGTLPFARTSLEAVIRAHLMADVPAASAANPGLPAAVDEVLPARLIGGRLRPAEQMLGRGGQIPTVDDPQPVRGTLIAQHRPIR